MPTVALLSTTFNTASGAKTVFLAPAVGDLILIAIAHTGDASWSNPTDDNPDGLGTYTIIGSIVGNSTSALAVYVRNAAIGSASITTFTAPDPGSDTGGGLSVIKVTGMSNYGIGAVRQSKSANIVTAPGSTGTWSSAKLTQNPVIGVLVSTTTGTADPTTGYTELSQVQYASPFSQIEVQSIDSGDTSSTMLWTGDVATSMTGQVMGIELNAPTNMVLDPAILSFTPQNPTIRSTITTTAAALSFTANAPQLRRANQLQLGSLDFNRQVFQITTVNNLAVSAFDFIQPGVSIAGNSVTLSAASMDFVADTIQLATTNNIAVGSLNLTGETIGQTVGPVLTVATMDFVEVDLAPVQIVALDHTIFETTAQTATPATVITLAEEPMNFVVLDVIPSNAPLGEVVNLVTVAFDFAINTIRGVNSITLDVAAFGFAASEISSTSVNNLAVSDLKLTPQNLTVTQNVVQVLLEAATFNFVARSLQPTGIASVGDKKRMLFGVGR